MPEQYREWFEKAEGDFSALTTLTESQSKHIRELLRDASARREQNQFVIEGPHLLEVAIEKRPESILQAIFTEAAALRHASLVQKCDALGIELFFVSAKLASRISDTEEPQGVFAVLSIPESGSKPLSDLIIALDGVQDPGNVGTIIRTAAWFGVKSIICGQGTADAYAPKVVRSTQGAIFDVSIESRVELGTRLRYLQPQGWALVATTLDAKSQSLYTVGFKPKTVLILGGEARGVNDELLELADERIVIPRYGAGESLNVATSAAVILSEIRRRTV